MAHAHLSMETFREVSSWRINMQLWIRQTYFLSFYSICPVASFFFSGPLLRSRNSRYRGEYITIMYRESAPSRYKLFNRRGSRAMSHSFRAHARALIQRIFSFFFLLNRSDFFQASYMGTLTPCVRLLLLCNVYRNASGELLIS